MLWYVKFFANLGTEINVGYPILSLSLARLSVGIFDVFLASVGKPLGPRVYFIRFGT